MLSYGVAVASITVAVAGARLLDIYLIAAPVSLLLCAIMFTAWVGGVRPAVLAMVLSLLAFKYYVVTPTHSFAVNIQEVPRIIFFALSALFVVWLSATQRHAVQALKKINEALHAENAERRRAEQALEEVAGRLINAQEEERSRIGRELHDHISQTLGVLTIKIDQLRAGGDIPPGVGSALDELRRDTTDITEDVHRLSHRLHSSTLDYLGLVPALQKLVSEFSERHGIAITFAHALAPAPLASAVALCLFRVAEEALTNIAKHSNARSANINVTGGPDGLRLTVEDAGTGFDTTTVAHKAGLGFVSMQERLRVLHGTIHVDSAPSRGTRIVACVPPTVLTGARGGTAHRSGTA
jgi:signal transduction histidine kinase